MSVCIRAAHDEEEGDELGASLEWKLSEYKYYYICICFPLISVFGNNKYRIESNTG